MQFANYQCKLKAYCTFWLTKPESVLSFRLQFFSLRKKNKEMQLNKHELKNLLKNVRTLIPIL